MGLTIYCRKTDLSMDLGGGGFLRLRRKVAELAGGPFFPVYQEVCSWYPGSNGETTEEFDRRINEVTRKILAEKKADPNVPCAFRAYMQEVEWIMENGKTVLSSTQ